MIVRELADEPLERSVPALRGAGGIDYTSEFLLDACKDIDCSPEEAERAARRLEFTRERARVYNNEQMAREQLDATHYMLLMTVRLMWMRSSRRARKLTTGGESDDMVQNAVLQFYKAINRFDWRKSSWVNYVSYWIDIGVRDVIYDWRTVRVPQNVQKDIVPLSRAIEGGIDSAHSNFLHATLDAYRMTDAWKAEGKRTGKLRDLYHARDQHPKFFAEDTDYGVATGARRETGEGTHYWRYNLFLLPFYTMPPSDPKQKFFHAFVPLDDGTSARWSFVWNVDRPITRADRALWHRGYGIHSEVHPGPEHRPVRNEQNDYLIDRQMQKEVNFTGIAILADEDYSVQESMGRIEPREMEHLGTTDVGIIKTRRRLLREASELAEGKAPHSAANGAVYSVRAGDVVLATDADWLNDEKVKDVMKATW